MEKNTKKAIASSTGDRSNSANFTDPDSNTLKLLHQRQLLEKLESLPSDWKLVAVGDNKAPLGKDWTRNPLAKEDFSKAVQLGHFQCLILKKKNGETFNPPTDWWKSVGVLSGPISGGLVFIDHDGYSCDRLIEQLSGQPLGEALPKTVGVTSGRPGRYQLIYRIQKQYWDLISTKKIPTGATSEDNKAEQLELRWQGCQSIVLGYHPITGKYNWLLNQSPSECQIAEAPDWIIMQMLEQEKTCVKMPEKSPKELALSFLKDIPSAEDYDLWIKVGMALHAVDEQLLNEWDKWSKGASNYEEGVCTKHWRSFKANKGIGLGTLGMLAKQHKKDVSLSQRTSNPSRESTIQLDELDELAEELAEDIQALLELSFRKPPSNFLFSQEIMQPLIQRAEQFNVPVESFLVVLLPVAASLISNDIKLEVFSATDYKIMPIIWGALVGESGATKTPVFKTILEPLNQLQIAAEEIYEEKKKQYQKDLKAYEKQQDNDTEDKPVPPKIREYFLQDATTEAIAVALKDQPSRGLVVAIDELSALFKGFDDACLGVKSVG